MYKLFINRPIVAMVISIIMVIVGALAILTLPSAQFPNITPPDIRSRPPMSARTPKPSNNRSPPPSSSR